MNMENLWSTDVIPVKCGELSGSPPPSKISDHINAGELDISN